MDLSSHADYMQRPCPEFDRLNNSWWGVQTMKFLFASLVQVGHRLWPSSDECLCCMCDVETSFCLE